MRFLLAFVLSFISVFALGQSAPPMKVGGPQGIDVTRLLSRDWLSVPIYIDTPAAPLTGAGWPGAAYLIQATKSYREATIEDWLTWIEGNNITQLDSIRWQDGQGTIYFLPKGIDTSQVLDYILYGDTSVWHYTGKKWRRVGGNAEFYFDYLLDGGYVTQVAPASSRQFTISPADYYLGGIRYKYDTTFRIQAPSKAADSTGRIDVIFLSTTGPRLAKGTPSRTPVKPQVRSGSIELASVYFRPFDTIPNVVNGKSVSSIYRIRGRDSIYYTIDTLTFAIKDSIGISRTDTASMLNPYKFTAANGLTKDSTVFRLGGSLNQNTDINLNTRRLTIIGGNDTTRFYAGGQISIAGVPDSNTVHHLINKKNSRLGNLEILSGSSAGVTGQGIRIDGADQTFKFQGTAASSNPVTFQFVSWNNDTFPARVGQPHLVKDVIRISQGFFRQSGAAPIPMDTGRYNVLHVNPKYNIFYDSGHTVIRGIYYNPIIQALNKTTHIAYQNTTGDNLLNSTSGNTRIGYTAPDTVYKFDVNGNSRINGDIIQSGTKTSNLGYIVNTGSVGVATNQPSPGTVGLLIGTVSNGGHTAIFTKGNNYGSTALRVTDQNIGNSVNHFIVDFAGSSGFGIPNNRTRVDTSAIVEIVSTNRGFLQPKMTNTERDNIPNEAQGLQIFSTTDSANYVYRGTGGGWQKIANEISASATLDFPSTNNGNKSDMTINGITGAEEGDVVALGIPNSVNLNHSCFTAWVSASGQVTVRFSNYGTGSLDPVSATFKVKVFK